MLDKYRNDSVLSLKSIELIVCHKYSLHLSVIILIEIFSLFSVKSDLFLLIRLSYCAQGSLISHYVRFFKLVLHDLVFLVFLSAI